MAGEKILVVDDEVSILTTLRKALSRQYPVLRAMKLTDYKVRILDSHHGTDAVTAIADGVADLRVRASRLTGVDVPAERAPSMIDELSA